MAAAILVFGSSSRFVSRYDSKLIFHIHSSLNLDLDVCSFLCKVLEIIDADQMKVENCDVGVRINFYNVNLYVCLKEEDMKYTYVIDVDNVPGSHIINVKNELAEIVEIVTSIKANLVHE